MNHDQQQKADHSALLALLYLHYEHGKEAEEIVGGKVFPTLADLKIAKAKWDRGYVQWWMSTRESIG